MINELSESLKKLSEDLSAISSSVDRMLRETLQQAEAKDRPRLQLMMAQISRAKNKALQGQDISNDLENIRNEYKDFK